MAASNPAVPPANVYYGGQAVIEGVMMRTPNAYAIAVRRKDGSITSTAEKNAETER